MSLANMHPEDVKAEIRKRFGSVFAFERANGIAPKTVSEHLRGKTRRGVAEVIEQALFSDKSENSGESRQAHYPKSKAA